MKSDSTLFAVAIGLGCLVAATRVGVGEAQGVWLAKKLHCDKMHSIDESLGTLKISRST